MKPKRQEASEFTNMAADFCDQNNYSRAIECCQKAIEIDPTLAEAYTNMGVAYKLQGNYTQAIECYKKALEINPNDADTHLNMGNVWGKLSNTSEKVKCYQKAVQLGSTKAQDWLRKNGFPEVQDELADEEEATRRKKFIIGGIIGIVCAILLTIGNCARCSIGEYIGGFIGGSIGGAVLGAICVFFHKRSRSQIFWGIVVGCIGVAAGSNFGGITNAVGVGIICYFVGHFGSRIFWAWVKRST
ncbi:hypothetical protein FACS189467_3150 [Bacteroidia bacterium]|nr:hypothetical protein FACS189467_3150 [Bacteroidia bacterium]